MSHGKGPEAQGQKDAAASRHFREHRHFTDLIVPGRRLFCAVHPVAPPPEDYRDRGARPDGLESPAGVPPACWAVGVA